MTQPQVVGACNADPGVQERWVDQRSVIEDPARAVGVLVLLNPRGPIGNGNLLGAFGTVGADERGDVVNAVSGVENPSGVGGRRAQSPDSSVRTRIAPQLGQFAIS